jgi:hypothetical protein
VDVTLDILLVLSNMSSRVSRYRLRDDQFVSWNLRGLLEHGVQKSMDAEEPKGPVDPSTPPLAIETMLGYTGSVGTTLWYEIGRDRGKVGQTHPRVIPFLTFFFHRHF